MHGQPKKLGEPKLEYRGDLVVGTVSRNGIDILTGTMAYKQRRDTLESLKRHFDFAENINLKAVDHIDGRPAIRQLTARRLAEVVVHECWSGPCTVELRPNAQAPVHRLPVVDMLDGFHWRADFTLRSGTDRARLSGRTTMSQYAWVLEVRPGYEEEYKKRHDEIWPEMLDALKKAGIRNYSIFRHGLTLFGYFETDDLDRTIAILKDDPVNARWGKSMAPIMKIEVDERRGFPFLLPLQWHMD